jgi:predicted PurR-regulated permease PerM
MAKNVSLIALLVLIGVIGILFYQVMIGFFVPLFLAMLLVVIFNPIFVRISRRLGDRPRTSALLTTFCILLIVLIPLAIIFTVSAVQGAHVASQFHVSRISAAVSRARASVGLDFPLVEELRIVDEAIGDVLALDSGDEKKGRSLSAVHRAQASLEALASASQNLAKFSLHDKSLEPLRKGLSGLEQELNMALPDEESIIETRLNVGFQWSVVRRNLLGGPVRAELMELANPSRKDLEASLLKVIADLQPTILSLTGATGAAIGRIVFGLVIMVISLYFFLVDGPKMVATLMRLSPLDDRYEKQLLIEFDQLSRAVVLAMILSAVAQGILAAIGYAVVGFDSVILLMLITIVLALIPFLGAAAVWAPCSLYLAFVEERWQAAIGLAIYGALIVSSIDNVIKAGILHGRSRLHPLLALLSVLGGVMVFGPIGILIGPMIVVFLQTSLDILNRELTEGHLNRRTANEAGRSPPLSKFLRASLGKRPMV